MLRKSNLNWVLVLVCLFLVSCSSTPKQKQLLTVETFNSVFKQYLDAYDRQPDSVKAKWKEDIDPHWKTASEAVGIYADMADPTTIEAKDKLAIYEAAKTTAIKLLLTYGVEIKEE